MNKIVEKVKTINSQWQPPNLKRTSTRVRFQLEEQRQGNLVTKCNQNLCGTSKHIKDGSNIFLKRSRVTFNIKQPVSCTVKNVIYCIACQECGEQYITETKNLRARVRVHKQHINQPIYRTLGVSEHIANCAKYRVPTLTIMPFYNVRTETDFREKGMITLETNTN